MATKDGSSVEISTSIDELLSLAKKNSRLAFKAGDYRATASLMEDIFVLKQIKKNHSEIQKDYSKVEKSVKSIKISEKPRKRGPNLRGKKTPGKDFVLPILRSIDELGGSAKAKDVLKKVNQKMRKKLNDYDNEPLPSVPSMTRCKQTAQMARIQMVKNGLLRKNSQRGVWEITAKGKKQLI